jgi:uncharacterized protein
VIDTAVHHRWQSEEEVLAYLDPGWRGYVGTPGSLPGGAGMRPWLPRLQYVNPEGDDLHADDGVPRASTPAGLAAELLEPQLVERALLLFDRALFAPAAPNPFLSLAMVRAINDWNVDRWLEADERLYGAVLAPVQLPEEAAAEIERIGSHPKVAAVVIAAPALGKTLGHPVYDPVFRAAAELELSVVLHRGGDALVDVPSGPAGGFPLTFAEYASVAPYGLVSQLVSVLTNGVLDKYPRLRICLVGAGVTWIPSFLLRFELVYRALRREVPWVRKPIRAYFDEQIRIATYGLERPGAGEFVSRLIDVQPEIGAWVVHGSGYPSWDTVGVGDVEHAFGTARADVLHGNASDWFRWPQPARTGAAAVGGVRP